MGDNIQLNSGSGGDVLAADDVGGIKTQRVKVQHGSDGVAFDASADHPLPTIVVPGTSNAVIAGFLAAGATKNLVGDYSGAGLAQASFAPSAGQIYRITALEVLVEDNGAFSATGYGAGSALTNGLYVQATGDGGTIIDLMDGVPVKTNSGWFRFGDATYVSMINGFLRVRIPLAPDGFGIRLDGDAGDRIQVLLSDNFSGLVSHYFRAVGYDESRLLPG